MPMKNLSKNYPMQIRRWKPQPWKVLKMQPTIRNAQPTLTKNMAIPRMFLPAGVMMRPKWPSESVLPRETALYSRLPLAFGPLRSLVR